MQYIITKMYFFIKKKNPQHSTAVSVIGVLQDFIVKCYIVAWDLNLEYIHMWKESQKNPSKP